MEWRTEVRVKWLVRVARQQAVEKHGPLKRGPERWSRLIAEEWREVENELQTLSISQYHKPELVAEARARLINELAQLAQLCEGVMELLIESGDLTEEA